MESIRHFLDRNKKRAVSVSVIGDTLVDQFYKVKSDRISPEFPIPILQTDKHVPFETLPGGAANVLTQMKGCNVKSQYFGFTEVGLFSNTSMAHSVVLPSNGQVPRKRRYFDGDFPLCRIDVEQENYALSPDKLEEYQQELLRRFKTSKEEVVIFSDYNKGIFSGNLSQKFIEIANNKENCPITIVDPKKGPLKKWKGCSIFKPNAKEAKELTGEIRVDKQIDVIMTELECQCVVISQGSDGVIGNVMGRPFHYKSNRSVQGHPLGYSGAGDCFIAYLAMAVAHTMDVVKASELAVEASTIYVQRRGNDFVSPLDILRHIDPIEAKFISPNDLRDRDYKLVFTNGCFDIFHSGHISLLRQAKQFGDKLVVALNTDESVARQDKSHDLINTLADRKRIISSLEFVDFVIEFDEDTPYNLIDSIRPDVLVKGGDYQNPVGSDIVPEVRIIPLVEGQSTTNIISKIKKS